MNACLLYQLCMPVLSDSVWCMLLSEATVCTIMNVVQTPLAVLEVKVFLTGANEVEVKQSFGGLIAEQAKCLVWRLQMVGQRTRYCHLKHETIT